MKKPALFLVSLTIVMLLLETELSSDLLLLFLVGAVPGTAYNLPSHVMLTFFMSTTVLVIAHLMQKHGAVTLLAKYAVSGFYFLKAILAKHTLGKA